MEIVTKFIAISSGLAALEVVIAASEKLLREFLEFFAPNSLQKKDATISRYSR